MKQTNPTQPSLVRLLYRLWKHLSRRRRVQFSLLIGLMFISTFADVASLGAVLPFLGVLTAPDKVFRYPIVTRFAQSWGITTADGLVLPLTILFAVAALLAGIIRVFLLWASTRVSYASGADLSVKVYRHTLYQPYSVHVMRNSSIIISGITHKVSFAATILWTLMSLIISLTLLIAVMITLFLINPLIASVAGLSFGGCYFLISRLHHQCLIRNGDRIAKESTKMVKALQEGLGGIRDVLLDGTQPFYCDIYRTTQQPLMRAQGSNQFIGASPRFAMEAFGMILIATLAYGLSVYNKGFSDAVPLLGTLAMGAQRLLPALQRCYNAWAAVVGTRASLVDALDLLDQPLPDNALTAIPAPLEFRDNIIFDSVGFRYSNDGPWVLDDFNLTITKGQRVGFVGRTGSGKSTTIDLLIGLLEPTQGRILVDGQPIVGEYQRAWQRSVALVPQHIYLADTTLAENIAFGVAREAIDLDRVRQAARQAHIADFIEGRNGDYQALVGERGIRLSGGQRQRIGIARALYKQASVLVFDEATSALDNTTEKSVMAAIEELSSQHLTILLIAHRITTVQHCDMIVELENGKVIAKGTYDQLLEYSPSFRCMALGQV